MGFSPALHIGNCPSHYGAVIVEHSKSDIAVIADQIPVQTRYVAMILADYLFLFLADGASCQLDPLIPRVRILGERRLIFLHDLTFRGLPPFLPFLRTAFALRSVLANPPLRPKSEAAFARLSFARLSVFSSMGVTLNLSGIRVKRFFNYFQQCSVRGKLPPIQPRPALWRLITICVNAFIALRAYINDLPIAGYRHMRIRVEPVIASKAASHGLYCKPKRFACQGQ